MCFPFSPFLKGIAEGACECICRYISKKNSSSRMARRRERAGHAGPLYSLPRRAPPPQVCSARNGLQPHLTIPVNTEQQAAEEQQNPVQPPHHHRCGPDVYKVFTWSFLFVVVSFIQFHTGFKHLKERKKLRGSPLITESVICAEVDPETGGK